MAGVRNLAASIVGWVLVALVAWLLLGFVIGTVLWVLRVLIVLVVIVGVHGAVIVTMKSTHVRTFRC